MLSRKLIVLALLFAVLLAALPSFSAADDLDVSDAGDATKSSGVTPDATDAEADEYDEETEEVEAEPQQYVMPAQDVQTYVKFLGISDNKFTAGEEVTALIGMTNSGPKTYNVSYVGAHLHSPYDFNFFVQNFTVRWTSNLLPPNSEVTVEYKFRPDEKLEPLDFHLSGWLIYNDSASTPIIYRSLFFNQTVEVTERRSEWTIQSFFTTALVLAGIAIAGYVVLSQTAVGKKATKRVTASAASSEGGNASAGWDAKIYKPSTVQKAVGGSKKHIKPTSQ
jgi:hypothetical protein